MKREFDKYIEKQLEDKEIEILAKKIAKKKKVVCFKCKKEIKFGTTAVIENKKPIHPICLVENDEFWD